MTRLAVTALFLLPILAIAEPPATHQVKLDGQTFTLPAGFTIEKVAGPPLVDRPIVATFDDKGRLYVADSSGSNEKPTEQLKHPNHRIIRLEDTKGTGTFDKATVFADKMMFPEGILWHRGSVYVGAPPHIWKLTDTDDDGVADKREIWFDGKTVTGCANDLHGPYLGPDGWIYWCKGAFAKQEYTLPNGKTFTTRASHIFRARPDGTGIEPVMTGGMDNPVGLAFLPNGERFFTCTFLQHPAAGKRDGIIHAVYGGIWGKDHDVIYDPDHKWTSPNLMPVMTHLGPAAPCGLCCYQSDAFGPGFTSNLFACQFNMHKVSRHILKPSGSTYTTEDSDFVVSDSTDFHPTDVQEDADGSLLIVNTGGWYKLCCPSSQLVKADVLGAIYRVRKDGAQKVEDPRGLKIDWAKATPAQLVEQLGDGRPAVQRRAIDELAMRDDKVIGVVRAAAEKGQPSLVRQNALWSLVRRVKPKDEADDKWISATLVSAALADDRAVREVAMHATALRRDQRVSTSLAANYFEAIDRGRFIEARIAAEALGRIGLCGTAHPSVTTVEATILKLDKANDTVIQHALIYALIEIGDAQRIRAFSEVDDPRVRRACLTALDQLGEKLDPKVVLEAMKSKDAALKETAVWIAGRHPEWGDTLASEFQKVLANTVDTNEQNHLIVELARFATAEPIQKLLADLLLDTKLDPVARRAALKAMERSGVRTLPDVWTAALVKALAEDNNQLAYRIAETIRALPEPKKDRESLIGGLDRVAKAKPNTAVRVTVLAAFPRGTRELQPDEFDLLLKWSQRDQPTNNRAAAIEALGRAKLNPEQLTALATNLTSFSPLELDRVLTVFAQTKDDAIGRPLVAALNDPALRSSLRADQVKERIKHFGPAVQKEAEKLYAALNAEYEQQRAKLDEVAKNLKPGDVRRGQAVFNSTKTSCIACHTIGYVGGKIGPDLTRVGAIRQERDLLESILFPSASFVRSYEPLTVRTKDGKVFNGIPKKDAPDEIVLILAADKEQRIAREDVEEVQPGKVSIMPAGLDKQLTEQELADLIAFLKACK